MVVSTCALAVGLLNIHIPQTQKSLILKWKYELVSWKNKRTLIHVPYQINLLSSFSLVVSLFKAGKRLSMRNILEVGIGLFKSVKSGLVVYRINPLCMNTILLDLKSHITTNLNYAKFSVLTRCEKVVVVPSYILHGRIFLFIHMKHFFGCSFIRSGDEKERNKKTQQKEILSFCSSLF